MRPQTVPILALLAAGVLATAGSASALYMMTPLQLTLSSSTGEVGDRIDFTLAPENESAGRSWAGQRVVVYYVYDPYEGSDGGRGAEDPEQSPYRRVILTQLSLDDQARGAFAWTIPAEVDDRNVDVVVETPEGELLAVNHLGVDDAPPAMRILAGSGPAQAPAEGTATTSDGVTPQDDGANNVPGAGMLALVGSVAGLALVLARRRG